MAGHVKTAVTREMDTSAMFEAYSIAEIRDIEKKTRQDIERKKEDLRQMVGERYRDLIEAADTITEMKNSAANVNSSISKMQDLCKNLKQNYPIRAATLQKSPKHEKQNQLFNIAKQIKLLIDVPEKIWSSLDGGEYLKATILFLQSRQVHTSLQLDSKQAAQIAAWFPVLSRQWDAISHFKSTILIASRERLKNSQVGDRVTAECLCSVLLLEDNSPRQAFNEFLLARMSTVQQLFHTDQTSTTIKTQVCEIVRIIVGTIHQVYVLFYNDEKPGGENKVPCNQLLVTLESVFEKREEFGGYSPTLKTEATPISVSTLKEHCQSWIDTCVKDINSGLAKLLGFISTVKGLSAIRDDIWELLKTDPAMKTWDTVCTAVLSRQISVWGEFFRNIFLERAKSLLQGHFHALSESSKQQIGRILADLGNTSSKAPTTEHDLSQYVWMESSGDIPMNMAWVTGQKSVAQNSTLMMKVKAFTPAIQSLCQGFDARMQALLDDANFYMKDGDNANDSGPFDRLSDNENLRDFLHSTCESSIQHLLEHLQSQLYACKQQLSGCQDLTSNRVIIDRVLLLGRLSNALSEMSPALQECMTNPMVEQIDLVKPQKKLPRTLSKTNVNPRWLQLVENLTGFSQEAFSVWSSHTSNELVKHFSDIILDSSGQANLLITTCWDQIEIEEETEDGRKIKSTIHVPMQSSWYLQSMLYSICEELNRIGGHAFKRTLSHNLTVTLWTGVLDAYERLLKATETSSTSLSQNRALQLLFDLKLLFNLLPRKEDKAFQRSWQSVVDRLEGLIDPFDLDVFTPYIQNHLVRHTQRCNVLYGALATLERQNTYGMGGKVPSSGRQEQHNVLALTTNQHRFSLLPISVQSRSSTQTILQPPKPKTIMHSIPTPSSPPPTFPPQRNSSFLGQVSTLWFSNISSHQ